MKSLATRMLALAVVQMLVMAIAAIVIWYFTAPHRGHSPLDGPPIGPPPHGGGPPAFGPLLTLGVAAAVLIVGSIVTARWIVRPIEQLSRTARALGAGDLSSRSGLARSDELGELGRRFDEMAAQLERMLATERELFANVAHELRTPLARIGVALDLAGEGDATRARNSLGEISVDVAELEVIVNDILTALRYDVSRGATMPLRKAPTSPASIAAAAAERMRARNPERPLELVVADKLPEIDVDPVLFRRVIDNLLENSHKYTPEATSPILLAVRATGNDVEFEVVDRGIGIATADLPNIYNTFFRTERSRARQTGGVGLGLTLAKRIVDAHGGTIEVTSAVGKGTRARVVMPRA